MINRRAFLLGTTAAVATAVADDRYTILLEPVRSQAADLALEGKRILTVLEPTFSYVGEIGEYQGVVIHGW